MPVWMIEMPDWMKVLGCLVAGLIAVEVVWRTCGFLKRRDWIVRRMSHATRLFRQDSISKSATKLDTERR